LQLVTNAGATAIATAHTAEEQKLVRDLGAQELVDYTGDVANQVLATHPQGVDVVLHFAGDPGALVPAVRPGGRLVSTLISSPEQVATETLTVVPIYANPDSPTLRRCADNNPSSTPGSPSRRCTGSTTHPLR
jgi:NADPH:quinone reductase